MTGRTKQGLELDVPAAPVRMDPLPLLYEDEEEGDLGESDPHVTTTEILHVCLQAHLAEQVHYQIFANMNLYYPANRPVEPSREPFVSPDIMVVAPAIRQEDRTSYKIGRDGPAPVLTMEVLSERSAQQRDLKDKLTLYAGLGIAEYILVDPLGSFLPKRLLLKRLQPSGDWQDEQDPDGGVTSRLGFRLLIDPADGWLRVRHASSGYQYTRPREAEARVRELEEEVARLRRMLDQP